MATTRRDSILRMRNRESPHGTTANVGAFVLSCLRYLRNHTDRRNLNGFKLTCWIILVLSGLVQAWFTRHRIVNDGISYLDIAKNYANGDWHAALNSYWSPLYSWLIAILLVCFHPSHYWEVGLLHVLNYGLYLAALVGFEFFIAALIRFQQATSNGHGLSEQTVRLIGYSVFLIATLLLINIGLNTPDMLAAAVGFFVAYLLVRMKRGDSKRSTYLWFGVLLGLGYLARAAFAPVIPIYIITAGVLALQTKARTSRAVAYSSITVILIAAPFVVAISASKGRVTLGDAGRLNYAWEICGAPRSIHWQGEPYDIGRPSHPTRKVLEHPATYEFASPVPGSYPPWYDPSYWYEGIAPRFKLRPQIAVLFGSLRTLAYLILRSPVLVPAMGIVILTGSRRWFSKSGIWAYWFLLIPTVTYIALYSLVYLDQRYIAGSLVILWMCLLASISVPDPNARWKADAAVQAFGLLFAVTFLVARMGGPTALAIKDLVHRREAEPNLNWMIAERVQQLGVHSGDRIAWIGEAMEAGWVTTLGARIVAEIPVISVRENTLFRRTHAERREIAAFWSASPDQKARVFQAFRQAGAVLVITDAIPGGLESEGWHRVLPPTVDLVQWSGGQNYWQKDIASIRLPHTEPSAKQ